MTATVNSFQDYYQGNYYHFFLKKAVAKANGRESHYNILSLLLDKPLIDGVDGEILYDTYAGMSVLHMLIPRVQIMMLYLLHRYGENIISVRDSIIDSRKRPSEILQLYSELTLTRFNSNLYRCLDVGTEEELTFLLGMKPIKFINTDVPSLRESIQHILDINNYSPSGIEEVVDIAVNNKRIEAAAMTCRALSYPEYVVSEIAGIIERWTLSI